MSGSASPPPVPNPPSGDDLQFDHVVPASPGPAPAATCLSCSRPIADQYYGVGDGVVCPHCRDALLAGPPGSKFGRLARAAVFGIGAGVAGALLWYLVISITGYSIGLIAIVVGFLVGTAVRKGARGKGGIGYQLTAVLITYLAVSLTYTALFVKEMVSNPASVDTAQIDGASTRTTTTFPSTQQSGESPAEAAETPPTAAGALAALAVLLGFFIAAPVLVGMQSPILFLIIGFALWEAWKLNKPLKIPFTGPFTLGTGGPTP